MLTRLQTIYHQHHKVISQRRIRKLDTQLEGVQLQHDMPITTAVIFNTKIMIVVIKTFQTLITKMMHING